MPLDPVLRSLLTTPGPSGYEEAPAAVWRAAAERFGEVRVDRLGSSTARVKGTEDGLSVAVLGHIDEIGLLVTYIAEDGALYFRRIGSWDPSVLVSQRVEILTRSGPVTGVIGKKPIQLSREETPRELQLKDLYVDIGARDRAEAEGVVEVGDVIVIAGEPIELRNDRIASRSMDNRLGCFVALEVLRLVAEAGGARGETIAVAAVQEEITKAGATVAAYDLEPDVVVVVDVIWETSPLDIDKRVIGDHAFGSGPTISRDSILHPGLHRLLRAAAEAEGIPFTILSHGTPTLTDSDAVHHVRRGIPTACVSIPVRYIHTSVETVQLDDVANAARLIAAFCLRLRADEELGRG
ncbi:MAG: M20/M25/M40 family metallo-hydrolase [Conexibacter sp.]